MGSQDIVRMDAATEKGETVLFLDDDEETVAALREWAEIELPSLRVIGTTSASEALRMLSEQRIAGVVADLQMPDMDGILFLKEAHARSPKTKLVLVTGRQLEEIADRLAGIPVEKVVRKPFRPAEFLELVRGLAGPGAR